MTLTIKRKLQLLILLALALLFPASTLASGENYSWKDSSSQLIEATGGSYSKPVEFKATQSNPNIYEAQSAILSCGNATNTQTVTLTLQSASAMPGQAVDAVVSAQGGTACQSNSLDAVAHVMPTAAGSTTSPATSSCDQGVLSWIVCPILDKVQQTISDTASKLIEPILRVSAISPTGTPALYNAWSNVRNLADVALMLLFLVIIAANVLSFGLDSYTVKRALPRLILAAIAVQFSFTIASLMVDLSNILGAGMGNVILGSLHPQNISQGGGTIVENIGVTVPALVVGAGIALTAASWVILFPLLVSLLIGVVAFFLTLAARLLLIAILIVMAPLALAAYVLPNTQNYYKQWQKLFTRLLLMYPIIMVLLAVAARMSELLSFATSGASNGATQFAVAILKPLIFVYMFALIPKTFKWAGSWMTSFSTVINKYRDQGLKRNRESAYYKDGQVNRRDRQLEYTRRLANSSAITKFTKSNNRLARGTGGFMMGAAGVALGGAATTPLAFNRAYSKQLTDYKKELDDLVDANNPYNIEQAMAASRGDVTARRYLENNAPSLLRYTHSQAGSIALMAKRVDSGTLSDKDLNERYLNPSRRGRALSPTKDFTLDYALALSAAGKDYTKRPFIVARVSEQKPHYEIKDQLGRVIVDENNVRDSAGNVINVPNIAPASVLGPRNAGDVDINPLIGQIRKLSSGFLGDDDKFSPSNLDAALRTDRVGTDIAWVWSQEAPVAALKSAMDPNARVPMSKVKRVNFVRMLHTHKELFQSGHGFDVKEAMLASMDKDRDVAVELVQRFYDDPAAPDYVSRDQAQAMTGLQLAQRIRTALL